jgi:hypothetical protein
MISVPIAIPVSAPVSIAVSMPVPIAVAIAAPVPIVPAAITIAILRRCCNAEYAGRPSQQGCHQTRSRDCFLDSIPVHSTELPFVNDSSPSNGFNPRSLDCATLSKGGLDEGEFHLFG